jgi:hypothetical protein
MLKHVAIISTDYDRAEDNISSPWIFVCSLDSFIWLQVTGSLDLINNALLCFSPWFFLNSRVEMVEPSRAALFARPGRTADLAVQLHTQTHHKTFMAMKWHSFYPES